MKKTTPMIDDDGEVRGLTSAELKLLKPAKEVLPNEFFDKLVKMNIKARGRPRLENPKLAIKLRLDSEIIDTFRATGTGWQSRINMILKKEARKINKQI